MFLMQKKLDTTTTTPSVLHIKMNTLFYFGSYEDTIIINTSLIIVSVREIEIVSFVPKQNLKNLSPQLHASTHLRVCTTGQKCEGKTPSTATTLHKSNIILLIAVSALQQVVRDR
jgi:hypothetical protein